MKRKNRVFVSFLSLVAFGALSSLSAMDLKSAVEQPDAVKILEKDKLPAPKEYTMPKGCVSSDANVIAIGEYIFHNLNGGKAKGTPPKGLAKKITVNGAKKPKQYGNCVACHNIEKAVGAGNIGPDLHNYKANFVDTKVRTPEYVYQQIADSRIHDKDSRMTINLTTGLFNEDEICAITSYVLSEKK